MTAARIAIADIGSNSARLVVVQRSGEYGLIPVSESKVLLRLQREIRKSGKLSPDAVRRLVSVMKDFDAVAKSADADQLVAVATSAVRNSANSDEVAQRVKDETGVILRVLTGREEADATFKGAVSSLPVSDGAVIDIGGGSMELVRFQDRHAVQTTTVPLGALKLSDKFLTPGDVSDAELAELTAHVESTLSDAGIEPLAGGAQIVGTGGTVRNAAKMDRRRNGMRFGRLHGHRIGLADLESTLERLAGMSVARLRRVPGLNPERTDSIVGGVAALVATVRYLGTGSILVSGAGLREGLALQAFGVGNGPTRESSLQSIRDMCGRFVTWDADRAARRAAIAEQVTAAFEDVISDEIAEAVLLASVLVDAGSAIDYYQRYASAALLVLNSNAGTLTHRQIALVSATCTAADGANVKASAYGGEIKQGETRTLKTAGVLLRLADEIEMRVPEGQEISVKLARPNPKKMRLRVSFPGSGDWQPGSLLRQYKSVLGSQVELLSEPKD